MNIPSSLLRATQALAELDEVDEILRVLNAAVVEELDCDRSTTLLVGADGFVHLRGGHGVSIRDESAIESERYRDVVRPIGDWLRKHRRPLVVDGPPYPDVIDPWFPERANIKSLLVVPLFEGDRLVGALSADRVGVPRPFPPESVSLAEALAMHASIALRRARLNDELRASEERYRILVEHAADIIFTVGLDGCFEFVSPSVLDVLGYTQDEVQSRHFSEVLVPDSAEVANARFKVSLEGGAQPPSSEYDVVRKNGEVVRLEVTLGDLRGSDGKLIGRHGIARNVTERQKLLRAAEAERRRTRRMLQREQRQRERAETMLQVVSAASSTLSVKKVLIQICDAVAKLSVGDRCSIWLYDQDADQMLPLMSLGESNPELFEKFKETGGRPEVTASSELVERILTLEPYIEPRVTGEGLVPAFWAETFDVKSIAIYPMSTRDRVVGMMTLDAHRKYVRFPKDEVDTISAIARQAAIIIENARLFERVQQQAETDFLTGLPNHRQLQALFEQVQSEAEREQRPFAIAMADIDHFKLLNDVHGHQAGDEALRQAARRLREAAGADHIAGRYGGDEFLFILKGLQREQALDLMTSVEQSLAATSLRVPGSDTEIPLRISFGIACYPDDGSGWRQLISRADAKLMERRMLVRSDVGSQPTLTTRDLREIHPETLLLAESLLRVIDAKDAYTSEHSRQHASLSLLLADELALPERERYALWLGGLLHDVGKIGVPDEILCKPGALTDDEWEIMRRHVTMSENIVRGLFGLDEAVEAVASHHERFDGAGYPRGLRGEEIPRLGRMLAIVDAYSAMVHDRPYRKGLQPAQAVAELRRHAGRQFDPDLIDAFLRAIGQPQSKAA